MSDIYLISIFNFSKFFEDVPIGSTIRTYNSISIGNNSICMMNCLKLRIQHKKDFDNLVV